MGLWGLGFSVYRVGDLGAVVSRSFFFLAGDAGRWYPILRQGYTNHTTGTRNF